MEFAVRCQYLPTGWRRLVTAPCLRPYRLRQNVQMKGSWHALWLSEALNGSNFSDFTGWSLCLPLSKRQHPSHLSARTFPQMHLVSRVEVAEPTSTRPVSLQSARMASVVGPAKSAEPTAGNNFRCYFFGVVVPG